MNTSIALFAGTWHLIADRSQYEFGMPPVSGVYTLEQIGEDIGVVISWMDHCGHEHVVRYIVTPDGREYAYEQPGIAETVMARFRDERTLETFAGKRGKIVAYAERTLNDDASEMVVVQTGKTPDGEDFKNVQYYRKQK
jgi:hypothetical protein